MQKRSIDVACLLAATALSSVHAHTAAFAQVSSTPVVQSTPSSAAETDQDQAVQIDDIIVTAQKRSERLSDVPLSITAQTGEQLERQGVTSTSDLAKVVPGFTFVPSSYGTPLYTIRGIGFFDEALGISPTVSVYVDQVPLPFGRMTEGAGLDVERVEALKGPQGTLFGQNSTGGAINYIASKPTSTFESGVDLTYGRFNQIDGQGFVSGPITDVLSARLAFRAETRDAWQESYTRDDSLGQRRFYSSRLLLDYTPSDTLRFEFNANGWVNQSDTQARQYIAYTPATAPTNPNFQRDAPGFPTLQQDLANYPRPPQGDARAADWDPSQDLARDDSFYQVSLRADKDFDWATLTSITALSSLEVDTLSDNDGTRLPSHRMNLFGDVESFSQEVRLAGSLVADDRLNWLVGVNYQTDDINDQQRLTFNGSNTGFAGQRFSSIVNLNTQEVETRAIFAAVDFALTDQLTLSGAVRYTDQERDYAGCFKDPGDGGLARAIAALSSNLSGSPTVIAPGACVTLSPTTNKPLPIIEQSLNDDNTSWRVNLSYKPNNELLLYANVTQGYKAGSFSTLPALRPAQLVPLSQESLLAYEAGFKVAALDRRLQVTAAAFFYDYSDKQLLGFVATGFPFGNLPGAVSVPQSEVFGQEIDVVFRPNQDLTLRLGAAHLDTEVTGSTAAVGPLGNAIDLKGRQFPATPSWTVTADGEYGFPLAGDWTGFVGASYSYRSSTVAFFGSGEDEARAANNPLLANFELDSYGLLDLRAGAEFQGGRYRILAWGRNVSDEFYYSFVNRVYDTTVGTTGMPATYGVTLSARY